MARPDQIALKAIPIFAFDGSRVEDRESSC